MNTSNRDRISLSDNIVSAENKISEWEKKYSKVHQGKVFSVRVRNFFSEITDR